MEMTLLSSLVLFTLSDSQETSGREWLWQADHDVKYISCRFTYLKIYYHHEEFHVKWFPCRFPEINGWTQEQARTQKFACHNPFDRRSRCYVLNLLSCTIEFATSSKVCALVHALPWHSWWPDSRAFLCLRGQLFEMHECACTIF